MLGKPIPSTEPTKIGGKFENQCSLGGLNPPLEIQNGYNFIYYEYILSAYYLMCDRVSRFLFSYSSSIYR